jgi:diguanylate cyclase (GGDEF)-like protein
METPQSAGGKLLYLWPGHSAEAQETARQVNYFGYEAVLFDTTAALAAAAGERAPTSVLVDLGGSDALSESDFTALTALAKKWPLACIGVSAAIEARLGAVRMGCQAYFVRPLDMSSLLDTLDRLTSPTQSDAGKVLVVDDSPSLAAYYAAHLNAAGFVTQVVTDPLKTLEALDERPPELILLDMNMPTASGQEIARVIRQQDAFLSIPIVFLSAESDLARQREAMNLGGDEFLHKPIEPEHLISAVRGRVIRYRALRALMVRDSLTGLLNHTSFKERLRAEVSRAKRLNKPLSVGLIDIDLFKKVNDTWGHPAGDRVIKNLARLLKQRLRGADVIGRYGGEEFAVALPDTPGDIALRVLDDLRASFAAIVQRAGEKTFQTTLSAGVAAATPESDAEALIQSSDEALYVAKHGGRNQVRLAGAME